MQSGLAEFVVQGMTMDGTVFQPAGWAQQLLDQLASAGSPNVAYASYMHTDTIDGLESLVVRTALKQMAPETFNAIKQFVANNHLMVRAGRGVINAEGSGPHRAIDNSDRRDPKRNPW